jgi:hypothetical protein
MEIYKTTVAYASTLPTSKSTTIEKKKEKKMKKLASQLFIIGTIVATYALPVLAVGGGGF